MSSLQKKTNKGHDYWYIVESKRIDGKPTPVVIQYLGTIENILNHFKKETDNSTIEYKSYAHGAVAALLKISKKIGLQEILHNNLKSKIRDDLKREESLIMAAIHRAISPGSKRSFSEWAETTTLPSLIKFDTKSTISQHFWDQMDGITEEELKACEDVITKRIFEIYKFKIEKLILDYTNYHSYISTANKQNTLAQRGHNKQKRYDLRQYSLAVVTTKDVLFPICSHIYEGNINDQTEFPGYIDLLKDRIPGFNADNITLVYDGGSNNKANIAKLENMGLHYICAFSLNSSKDLYNIPIQSYKSVTIKGNEILFYRLLKDIWGKERESILVYSQKLFEGQVRELENDIIKNEDRLSAILEKLNNEKSKIKKDRVSIKESIQKELKGNYQQDIFEVNIEGDPVVTGITWKINTDKKSEIIAKYFGKKLLITDHQQWSTEEILTTYSDQYIIERIFRDTKNPHHFSIRPQYHWTDMKIRVHIFCCLLGLVMTSLLKKEMEDKGIIVENDELIDEFTKIRECWVYKKTSKNKNGLTIEKKLEMMNAKQSKMWKVVLSL
jgi:transposase